MPVGSELYVEVLHNMDDAIYLVDNDRKIVFWNDAAERCTGYVTPDVIGRRCGNDLFRHTNFKGTCLCKEGCPMERTFRDLRPREIDLYSHKKDGIRVLTRVLFSPVKDPTGKTVMAVKFQNIQGTPPTCRMYDEHVKRPLELNSSIEDRKTMESTLRIKLDQFRRYRWPFATLLFSVDKREDIIQTYGYTYWYKVLRMVTDTINSSLRSSDRVGQWSENEFVAVILNVDKANLKTIAERLRVLVAQTQLMFYKEKLSFTISIGASLAIPDDDGEMLSNRCSLLLRKSLSSGGNCTSI